MSKLAETALFLGKFQPPHLGHISTILRISDCYEQLIVGITEGEEKIIDQESVKKVFDEVLHRFPGISSRVISGSVEKGTVKLPKDFDLIISGNRSVLDILSKQGIKTKFQERSIGPGFSGTEIRSFFNPIKNLSAGNRNSDLKVEIVELSKLRPLEKVLRTHLDTIGKMIEHDGAVIKPILIDSLHGIVLDGSHRYAYLLKAGFNLAPVIKVEYEDEAVFVGSHLKHRFYTDKNFKISKKEVTYRGLNGDLFEARTTRHFFPFRKEDNPTDLSDLEKGVPRNIDHLISSLSLKEEILEDSKYINEINEEIEILKKYITEQHETKEYLQTQISRMEELDGV